MRRPPSPFSAAGERFWARRRWFDRLRTLALTLVTAAVIGMLVAATPTLFDPAYPEVVRGCRVVDGDSLLCADGERVRLLGIDAPELGECPPGRRCAPGDAAASTTSLRTAVNGFAMRAARFETDRHGRTVAAVRSGGGDLSCHQLWAGQADYRADWDRRFRIARTCLGERY